MVEFAIVLPIFMTCILGLVEFGRAFMVSQVVVSAARVGVRAAIIEGVTDAQIKTAVTSEFAANALNIQSTDVTTRFYVNGTLQTTLANAQRGDQVGVYVMVPFSVAALTTPNWLAGANLSAQAIMRRE